MDIPEQTLEEIYTLAGVEPDVMALQCKWAFEHPDKRARKLAAQEWGRDVKAMAFVWDKWQRHLEGASRHSIMSLLLIATLPRHDRPMLYEQWRETTMSYEDVREAVAARKGRKSKGVTLKDKLAALIKELDADSVCGAGLEVVCTRRAIADKLRGLLEGA